MLQKERERDRDRQRERSSSLEKICEAVIAEVFPTALGLQGTRSSDHTVTEIWSTIAVMLIGVCDMVHVGCL